MGKSFALPKSKTALLALLLPLGIQAQALRCDLVQSNATCFDIDTLQGRTITVPSNVTRLENQGINLCQSVSAMGGNADFSWVYDNSGSMNVSHAFISGVDTTYYYGTGGCASTTTGGAVTIQTWNAAGTAVSVRTVPILVSNTGCTAFSGDPHNARGRAYRLGIQYMATQAPQSMAGIMSFTTTAANLRRPLTLNTAANINNLLGAINAVSNGGTDYTPPLDSSRNWLRTASITPQTPGRTKAIIFLSDGLPANTNYLPLDPATPPVYGIFLGRDTANSGRLGELSLLTGGQLFLVPPTRPDSLISLVQSVVSQILNIVLIQYNPLTLNISNTTLGQASTGALTLAAPLTWRLRLDSIIGLGGAGVNAMRIERSFEEIRGGVVTDTISDTTVFNLSITGAPATATTTTPIPNAGGATFATRCYAPSRIQWQTLAGVRPAYVTEADSLNLRLRLRVAASDSDQAGFESDNTTSFFAGESEIANLARMNSTTDSTIFVVAPVPMRVSALASSGNGILEHYFSDSLIARWGHPRDARDFARDTIRVQPANSPAVTWFANSPGGSAVSYFSSATPANGMFVVVRDNRAMGALTYVDTIWNDSLGTDRLVLTLAEYSPGLFTAQVPFQVSIPKNPGDGILQISPSGDMLHARYRDPLYGEIATAIAGFAVAVDETPMLWFTDAAGRPYPDSAVIPFSSTLYIRYADDNVSGGPSTKNGTLFASSVRAGISIPTALNTEPIQLLDSGLITPTLRVWKGSFTVNETLTPVSFNTILEGAYRMISSVGLFSHNNMGSLGSYVSRTVILAHPDSLPALTWAESLNVAKYASGGPVDVVLTLKDQDFVRTFQDTVLVTAVCPSSGDSVPWIRLREQTLNTGNYTAGEILTRDGAAVPNLTDRILSCPAGQPLTINYTDAVYGVFSQWAITETATPTASPPGGTSFPSQITIAFSSATPGAAIRYTLDNSLPQFGMPQAYAAPFTLVTSDTVRAAAFSPGSLRSRMLTAAYIRAPLPSTIVFLDTNGNPIQGDTIPASTTALRILVTTSQTGLSGLVPVLRSQQLGDAESFALGNFVFIGNTNYYWDNVVLQAPAAAASGGDNVLQAMEPDTLIAVWVNPMDTSDVARDTLWISGPPTVLFFPVRKERLKTGGKVYDVSGRRIKAPGRPLIVKVRAKPVAVVP